MKVDEKAEKKQIADIKKFKSNRDKKKLKSLLEELKKRLKRIEM